MLVVQCPGCSARFKAKDELLGQTRKCPKCSEPILIEEGKTAAKLAPKPAAAAPAPAATPEPPAETKSDESSASEISSQISFVQSGLGAPTEPQPAADQPLGESGESELHKYCHPIKKLNRSYRYLVLAKDRITAYWKADGHGWILKTRFGNVACKKNRDQIPAQGTFVLVEIILIHTDDGMRLAGLRSFKLGTNRALDAMSKTDDMIASKITSPGGLGREQKDAIRSNIREQFMSVVWQDASNVLEFLGNQDYHSCMIVEDGIDPAEV